MREYLKSLRNKCGKTQGEIAEKLDVSESYYNLIENGERQMDMNLSIMTKLADAFDVSLKLVIDEEMEFSKTKNQPK